MKFETHLLGPAPHRDYQRLSHWIHLLEVSSVPPTWGTCHDFMGNEIMNNVSQQVMKGENVIQSKELI